MSKIRAGGTGVEVEGKKGVKKFGEQKAEQREEEGEIIELDLGDIDEEE